MLDIKQIVANPEEIKKRLSLRKPALAQQIDEVLTKYDAYKKILARVEELRAKRNEMSKSIGKIKKEQGYNDQDMKDYIHITETCLNDLDI